MRKVARPRPVLRWISHYMIGAPALLLHRSRRPVCFIRDERTIPSRGPGQRLRCILFRRWRVYTLNAGRRLSRLRSTKWSVILSLIEHNFKKLIPTLISVSSKDSVLPLNLRDIFLDVPPHFDCTKKYPELSTERKRSTQENRNQLLAFNWKDITAEVKGKIGFQLSFLLIRRSVFLIFFIFKLF